MRKYFYVFSLIFVLVFFSRAVFSFASSTVGSIDPSSSGFNKAYLLNDGGIGGLKQINTGKFTTQSSKNVVVTDTQLTGYIWGAETGWISLNCSNTNACARSNYKVSNDNEGHLSGYGWGAQAGWVKFKCVTNCNSSNNFGVTIDSSGDFIGYAWSQAFGYISFNCSNDSSCGTINFKTNTDWRPVSTRTSSSSTSSGGGGSSNSSSSSTSSTSSSSSTSSTSSSSTSSTSSSTSTGGPQDTSSSTSTSSTSSTSSSSTSTGGPDSSSTSTSSTSSDGGPQDTSSSTSTSSTSSTSTGGPDSSSTSSSSGTGDLVNTIIDTLFGGSSSSGSSGGGSSSGGIVTNFIENSVSNISNIVTSVAVQQTITQVTEAVKETRKQASKVVEQPTVATATKVATTAGVVSGTVVTVGASIFLNPIALSEIVFVPIRLWSLILVALGIRKRRKPWGTVYDSVTKQPIDPAYVVLLDMMGNEIATSITDLDGRYGFLAPAGVYKIVASKTNYKFPSDRMKDRLEDELYIDLYKGDTVTITKEGDVITKNIPLDPEKFDWNEFAKNQQSLMKFSRKRDFILDKIGTIAFDIGFAVSAITTFLSPSTYGEIIIGIYVVLGIVRYVAPRSKTKGAITRADGTPLSYGILRVFSNETNMEIAHKVADAKGNFYALVQNGKYYVTIEQKNPDESYTKVFTSEPFEVKKGIIKQKFVISNVVQAPATVVPHPNPSPALVEGPTTTLSQVSNPPIQTSPQTLQNIPENEDLSGIGE